LWRSDRDDIAVSDACHLHEDVLLVIEYLFRAQRAISDAIALIDNRHGTSKRAYRPSIFARGPCGSIIKRLKTNAREHLPKMIVRIELFVQQKIKSSSSSLLKDLLKPNIFLVATRSRSDTLPTRGQNPDNGSSNKPPRAEMPEQNQQGEQSSPSSPREKDVATVVSYSDSILGAVNSRVLEPFIDVVRRNSSFPTAIRILSSGMNSVLTTLFAYILKNKLRFSQQGVTALYVAMLSFVELIATAKTSLFNELTHGTTQQPIPSFHLIEDTGPWLKANQIIMILLSGMPPKSSGLVGGHKEVDHLPRGLLAGIFGNNRRGQGNQKPPPHQHHHYHHNNSADNILTDGNAKSVSAGRPMNSDGVQLAVFGLPRYNHISLDSWGNAAVMVTLHSAVGTAASSCQQLDTLEIQQWLELAAVHPHGSSSVIAKLCCVPIVFSRKKNATIGVVLAIDLSKL
jgi:hypothetical protein